MVTSADPVQRTSTGWDSIRTKDTWGSRRQETKQLAFLLAGNGLSWMLSYGVVGGDLCDARARTTAGRQPEPRPNGPEKDSRGQGPSKFLQLGFLRAGTRLAALFQTWPLLHLVRLFRVRTGQSFAQREILCPSAHYRSFAHTPFQSSLAPLLGRFQGGHTILDMPGLCGCGWRSKLDCLQRSSLVPRPLLQARLRNNISAHFVLCQPQDWCLLPPRRAAEHSHIPAVS